MIQGQAPGPAEVGTLDLVLELGRQPRVVRDHSALLSAAPGDQSALTLRLKLAARLSFTRKEWRKVQNLL